MHRILVVDDEKMIRLIVRRALERFGYAVEEAGDGREAVTRLPGGGVDLVILDMQMPGQTGVETIGQIREASTTVPIIAISGHDVALEDALLVGASASLPKPFSIDALIEAVRGSLKTEA